MTTKDFEMKLIALVEEYERSNDNAPCHLTFASIEAVVKMDDFSDLHVWEEQMVRGWNGDTFC